MTRTEAEAIIAIFLPRVTRRQSAFLTPFMEPVLDAKLVFDTIREACEPAITKAEFNALADAHVKIKT